MILHHMWVVKGTGTRKDVWHREGWFLFGFLPLYIRTFKHEYFL